MSKIILPGTLVGLLATFEPCFHAPSYRTFQCLVAGWIHCLGGSGRSRRWPWRRVAWSAADEWYARLCAAGAVPPVRRGQAGRDQGCPGPTPSRHAPTSRAI